MERLNSNRTYSEMYELLNLLGDEYIKKIPKKLYSLICNQRDSSYEADFFGNDGLLDESKISQETVALFSVLNIKYFMDNEEEKKKLLATFEENERRYQEELREKLNPDDIFKNREKESKVLEKQEEIQVDSSSDTNVQMIEYKENIFQRIWNKIKNIFKRN